MMGVCDEIPLRAPGFNVNLRHVTSPGLRRAVATAAGALLLALVLWPLSWRARRDSFPLSTYPMFSDPRSRVMTVDHVFAVTPDGERMIVPLELIATNNVMHVAMVVSQAATSSEASAALCDEVARKVATQDGRLGRAVVIEVATSSFDSVAYFAGHRTPRSREIRARCQVAR
jgi:hypothetical protein